MSGAGFSHSKSTADLHCDAKPLLSRDAEVGPRILSKGTVRTHHKDTVENEELKHSTVSKKWGTLRLPEIKS